MAETVERVLNIRVDSDTSKLAKIRAELPRLTKDYDAAKKELAAFKKELKGTNTLTDQQAKKLGELDGAVKKSGATYNRAQRQLNGVRSNTSGLTKSLGGLGLAFTGVGALVGIAVKIFSSAVQTIKEFEQSTANLAAIFGVSVDSIKPLIEQAKELGATTQFTASQVLELQGALAKLGFTSLEIQAATGDVLNLAAALDVELGRAAEITGATLRQFGLDASEAGRVADVFSIASSKSAVNAEFLAESLKTAGAAANASGIPLEQVASLIGVIANSGLDASTAGTSLRNIFIELGNQGLTLDEALSKIGNSQNKLTAATDLFGKRSAVAAVILATNRKAVADLDEQLKHNGRTQQEYDQLQSNINKKTDEFTLLLQKQGLSQAEVTRQTREYKQSLIEAENAGDGYISAAKIAEERNNTLEGSLKKLSSAWEGLVLKFSGGGNVLKNIINGLVVVVSALGNAVVPVIDLFGEMGDAFSDVTGNGDSTIDMTKLLTRGFELAAVGIKAFIQVGIAMIRTLNLAIEKGKELANFLGADFELDPTAFDKWADSVQQIAVGVVEDTKKVFTVIGEDSKQVTDAIAKQGEAGNVLIEKLLEDRTRLSEEAEKALENELEARKKKLALGNDELKAQVSKTKDFEALYQKQIQAEENATNASSKIQKNAFEQEALIYAARVKSIQEAQILSADASEKSQAQANKAAIAQEKALQKELDQRQKQLEEFQRIEQAKADAISNANSAGLSQGEATVEGDRSAELEKLEIEFEKRKEIADRKILLEGETNDLLILETERYNREVAEANAKYDQKSKDAFNKTLDGKLAAIDRGLANEIKLIDDGVIKTEDAEKAKSDLAVKAAQDRISLFVDENQDLSALNDEQLAQYKELVEALKLITDKATEKKSLTEQLFAFVKENKKEIINGAIDIAHQISSSILSNQQEQNDRMLDSQLSALEESSSAQQDVLQAQFDAGLYTEAEYEARREKLAEDTAKKELAIKKKAFEKEKKLRLIGAIIDTAASIGKTFATLGYPAGVIPAVLAAATGAVQIATISSQKFAKGGQLPEYANGGLLQGASHSQGGIPLFNNGNQIAEVEGGEYIINRSATAANLDLLKAINASGNGTVVPISSNLEAIEAEANLTQSAINRNASSGGVVRAMVMESDVTQVQTRLSKFRKQAQTG